MKIKTRKQIDVHEFDNLVESTYGKIYNFQQQDDCKGRGIETIVVPAIEEDYENTEVPFKVNGEEMGVSFQAWLDTKPEDTRKYFEADYQNDLFWERNFYPHVSMVLNDLHKKGLIEAGEYDIDIDW